MIGAYEKRIAEQANLSETLTARSQVKHDIAARYRTALGFLANPWNLSKTGRVKDRGTVLKITYRGHFAYKP